MEIIRHRRNTIAELQATPTSLGVEVDIRSYADRLTIHHDPFIEGDSFEDFFQLKKKVAALRATRPRVDEELYFF